LLGSGFQTHSRSKALIKMNQSQNNVPQGNVPVLQCVFAGWGFFVRNWKQTYFFALPFLVTSIIGGWLNLFAVPETTLAGLGPLLTLISWVLFLMMGAALYRLSLGMPASGIGGLNLGADELRLFLTSVLVALIASLVAMVVSILVMFAISPILASGIDPELLKANPNLIYEQSSSKMIMVLGASVTFVWLVIFYLLSRFSLAFPAAFVEKKVRIFEAAAWTKGQGWRIVLASIIAFSPVYIFMAPDFLTTAQGAINAFPAAVRNENLEQITAENLDHMRDTFHWKVLVLLLVPSLAAIRVGLFTALYRGLRSALPS